MPSVAEKMIKNVDKSRIQYHRRYCKGYQDELTGKDLAIDSGRFGIEGAAQIIKSVMWAKGYNRMIGVLWTSRKYLGRNGHAANRVIKNTQIKLMNCWRVME